MRKSFGSIVALTLCTILVFGSAPINWISNVNFNTEGLSSVSAAIISFFDGMQIKLSASAAESGTCGNGITWNLDDEGTLTISGTGAMTYYYDYSKVPWYSSRTSIKNVVISNGVTNIGGCAFYDCTNLKSIIIPNSVTYIGDAVFYGCTNLSDITIPDSITYISCYVFCLCTGLESITIPSSVTSIGSATFVCCSSLKHVTIGNGIKTIPDNLFRRCTALTTIDIPSSVNSIGEGAFLECTGLKSVTIPNTVTKLERNAFQDCTSLKNITIPNSVNNIGIGAFESCTSLTGITLSNSVTIIGYEAFYDCAELSDVYYSGSEKDRSNISIGTYNDNLENATWHYNSNTNDMLKVNLTVESKKILVDYKSTVIFHATVKCGDESKIVWYKDGKLTSQTGAEYKEEMVMSSFNLQAKYVDGTNTTESDIADVEVNTGFFARIIAFFKGLFGSLPTYADGKKQ